MSSIDTLISDAGKDVNTRIEKLRIDIKTALEPVIPPTPVPPQTNIYDDYPTIYDIKTGNTVTSNGKWRVVYCGYNPSNSAGDKGQAGVRIPLSSTGAVQRPGDASPRVLYAYPYANPNTSSGTNATLTLTESKFTNFDLTFWMRTIKGGRSPTPKNWETAWLLFRFNTAGLPVTDKGAHFHHYFYDIQRNGTIEFGRKDNTQGLEEQTFLSTAGKVVYADGKWFKIRIKAVGNRITNWVDDALKFDVTDNGSVGTRSKQVIVNGVKTSVSMPVEPPSTFMNNGMIGPYAEDSICEWGPFTIIPQ